MAYIINRFDGTQLTIVDDGILDNSTPLGLIGRNYTGYGETQNENFVFLLENFANTSPPARALRGQIWYNTTDKALKTYNGTNWLSIGNATVAETEPPHSSGGLWLNSVTNQLYVSDGTTWRLVGPEGVDGFSVTKMTSTKIRDSIGAFKPVIICQINGTTTAILTNEAFTINTQDSVVGFSQLENGINLKDGTVINGNVLGNTTTATRLETSRTINNVEFDGTSSITVTSNTNQPLKPGDYIIGSEFNGAFDTTWDIDATPNNAIGKIVARDTTGGFSASSITANEFIGNLLGNVTTISGTSTFNRIIVDSITGNTFSGTSATATKLFERRTINTVPFDGTANITLPVPAETLTGNTLAPNIVNSSLTTLGQLEYLTVEAPGITVGDGNNLNIKIEGFTPTIESDTTNILKLKLATGAVSISPTTLTFLSASAAAADGVSAPAFVPDYTLGTAIDNRPVLGLPSNRWGNIYSKTATLDTLNVTTIGGRTTSNQVVVSKDLVVSGTMFGNVSGNLTGNVTGASSLNVLKSGDGMSGDISWSTTGRGIRWVMNTDGASIRFYNVADGDTDSRLEFNTSDNNDEYFRWTHSPSGGTTYESMRLTPSAPGASILRVTGQITVVGGGVSASSYIGDGNQLTNLNATQLLTGTVSSARLAGSYNINVVGNITGNLTGNVTGNTSGIHSGAVIGNVTGAASLNLLKSGDTMTGDLNIVKDNAWLVLDSPSVGTDGQFQAAGISLGESGYKGSATLHFTYTGDGFGHIGMGPVNTATSLPQFEAIRLYYLDNTVRVLGNMTVAGTASGTFAGTGTGLTLDANNLITGIVPSTRLSGTYGISINGNAGTATRLLNTRTINGIGFDGTGNINVSEYVHSNRDFTSGTLITTNINYAVSEGEPWVLEIKGNSYGALVPWDIQYQGYIYSGTIINHGGISNGTNLSGLIAINNGGVLCFWFPRQEYWQGFNVKVYVPYATVAANRVTSIVDSSQPGSNKLVNLSANIRQSLHSGNFNSYVPTLTGSGASGTWNINIGGNANTVTSITGTQVVNGLGYTPANVGLLTNQSGTGINGTTGTFSSNISAGNTSKGTDTVISVMSGDGTKAGFEAYGSSQGTGYLYVGQSTVYGGGIAYNGDGSPSFIGGETADKVTFFRRNAGTDSEVFSYWYYSDQVDFNGTVVAPSFIGSLTGNVSGNVFGNANTVTAITSTQVVNALGYTPVNPASLTNQGGAAITGSTATLSGRLTVAAGSTNGIYWPNDAFGGSGDTARITLETASGEATRMRFTMTNDADDFFEFAAPSANGLRMNNNIVLHAANYNDYAPTRTGTGASGTWPINVTGNAATVTTVTSGQIAGGLGYTPISKSGDLVNGELNLQDNNLKRATIIDYSLAHNALGNVSGGVTVNMELGNYASATAVGALTWTFANPPTGARAGSIILELTNGGAYTQYWPASVRWPAGAAPSLAAAGVDVLVFITDDGGTNWRGAISMGDSR